MDLFSRLSNFFSNINDNPWDAEMSALEDFWGDPDYPVSTTPLIIPEPLGIPSDFDFPSGPVGILEPEPEPESEPDPLEEEKRKAADAARALRLGFQLAHGRSSTFLTRGMDLGAAPAAVKTLLGQGW